MRLLRNDFKRPSDWPKGDVIDLDIHDLPHDSSTTEWWYINSHITSNTGKKYSVFASFFRRLLKFNEETQKLEYAHSITWAIIDVENQKYYNNSLIDQRTPEIGLERLRKGEIVKDERIRKSAIEMLEKGNVPYPDRLFKKDVQVSRDKLDLKFDRNSFRKLDNGNYELILEDIEHKVGCTMVLEPQKPVTRHGDNGVVFGVSAEDMFYYFIPRNKANGFIEIEGERIPFENSTAWYDHEFGRHRKEVNDGDTVSKDVAWNWISSQLSNGYEFTAYDLIDNDTEKGVGSYLILIDPQGNRIQVDEFSLRPKGSDWTSTR
ncbi:carotenoid 1,2-hydratase, partial [Chitinophagales bacterium]|nr:carotenoid 1,2-hydratase [Chitinophagales bacterium]